MQVLCTCDLAHHQLGTKHCADSPGLFQQQAPASANFLCQLGNERSQIPLFQISTISRKEGSGESPYKVTHNQKPASNYRYCSYGSRVNLLNRVSAQRDL